MEPNTKKDLRFFIAAMVVIVVTFATGLVYLKGQASSAQAGPKNGNNLVADAIGVALQGQPAGNGATIATSTTTTSTAPVVVTSPSSTVTKPVVQIKPAPAPSPAPKPTPVPTPSPVPAPKPTPAPAPAPAPAPKPTPAPIPSIIKTLPFVTTSFSKDQAWQNSWGLFTLAADSLTIGATKNGTEGGVLLGGTNALSDYTFSTTLDWNAGEAFDLMARYTDSNNYTFCEFDQELADTVIHIRVKQRLNGATHTLAEGDVLGYNVAGGTNIAAYIRVQGTTADCSFNNHVISSAGTGNTLNPPYTGRLGFRAWDSDKNNSEIVVKSVSVTPNY